MIEAGDRCAESIGDGDRDEHEGGIDAEQRGWGESGPGIRGPGLGPGDFGDSRFGVRELKGA